VRGEQDIIVRYEPDEALATLPRLLRSREDRERLVTLVRRLLDDDRVRPSREQLAMVEDIGAALSLGPATGGRAGKARKTATKTARKTASKTARKTAPTLARKTPRKTPRVSGKS